MSAAPGKGSYVALAVVEAMRTKIIAGEVDASTATIGTIYAAYNLARDLGMDEAAAFKWMRDTLNITERDLKAQRQSSCLGKP